MLFRCTSLMGKGLAEMKESRMETKTLIETLSSLTWRWFADRSESTLERPGVRLDPVCLPLSPRQPIAERCPGLDGFSTQARSGIGWTLVPRSSLSRKRRDRIFGGRPNHAEPTSRSILTGMSIAERWKSSVFVRITRKRTADHRTSFARRYAGPGT